MSEREQIGKGLRWKIYARDGFACRYCGLKPPDAILHIDHVTAVIRGGKNDEENLVTACQDCNIGKGAKLIPQPMSQQTQVVVPLENVGKVATIESEFPHVARRFYEHFIEEAKASEQKGHQIETTMVLLSMAAIDAAALVYFRLKDAGKKKRDFLAMCAAAYDEHKERSE